MQALAARLRHDLDSGLVEMVGIGHLEVRLSAREEHGEHLGEVGVDRIKDHQELPAHLALDGCRNLGEGTTGALEVCHLLVDVVGALL